MTSHERIAELEAENAALRTQVNEVLGLREQVTRSCWRGCGTREARLASSSFAATGRRLPIHPADLR